MSLLLPALIVTRVGTLLAPPIGGGSGWHGGVRPKLHIFTAAAISEFDFLRRHNLSIDQLDTISEMAPVTATKLFLMEGVVSHRGPLPEDWNPPRNARESYRACVLVGG
jgi:hypothetical protein